MRYLSKRRSEGKTAYLDVEACSVETRAEGCGEEQVEWRNGSLVINKQGDTVVVDKRQVTSRCCFLTRLVVTTPRGGHKPWIEPP